MHINTYLEYFSVIYFSYLDNILKYVFMCMYLYVMIENNLLEYLDGTHEFKTTEKGLNYLNIHNESRKLLPQTTTIENYKLI